MKIFDFGLTKELKPALKLGPDQYIGRHKAGTLRYMAPEVSRGEPYGLPADVYAFSLVLWQLMSLSPPFEKLKGKSNFVRSVHVRNLRPRVKKGWPKPIKNLLQLAWHSQPSRRPNMEEIIKILASIGGM